MKITTGIRRLDEMVEVAVKSRIRGGVYLLDCYCGKKIRSKYSNAITTRVSASNGDFVLEVYEEDSREF